jgi:hypothetical protein
MLPVIPFPALTSTARGLASQNFDALIATHGQRVSWMRSHGCPCVYAGGGANGRLPQIGAPQRSCTRCLGLGVYWDAPSMPFRAYIEYMHMSPTPDEPGVKMNESYGVFQTSEPSMTIPFMNPTLAVDDPGQPTDAWTNASTDDGFVAVDMQSRYTAVLQSGTKENLPFQQNLRVAPQDAVTVWDPTTGDVDQVAQYAVSGATVTIGGYPPGTNYMVEFQAAPFYVAFRGAGGLPHVRPLGGGTVTEPRRFRLQALDFWTRQRGIQPQAPGSVQLAGTVSPFTPMVGRAVAGS